MKDITKTKPDITGKIGKKKFFISICHRAGECFNGCFWYHGSTEVFSLDGGINSKGMVFYVHPNFSLKDTHYCDYFSFDGNLLSSASKFKGEMCDYQLARGTICGHEPCEIEIHTPFE